MGITFYPLDFEYTVRDGKVFVLMYGALEQGGKVCVTVEHKPYFYAAVDGVDTQKLAQRLQTLRVMVGSSEEKVTHWEEVEKELLGQRKKLWKLYTSIPKAVPELARTLESWGLSTFEKDILFVHRFLRDCNITPAALVTAEGDFIVQERYRVPFFAAHSVEQVSKESLATPRILALDLETYAHDKTIDFERNPILMAAVSGVDEKGNSFRKLVTWKQFPHSLDYIDVVESEKEFLLRLKEIIIDFNPDIITGYFSDGFDFPYIKTRADMFGIHFDVGLDRSPLFVSRKTGFRDREASITGILHLDMLQFVRNIFGKNLKTDTFSLDAVAWELLQHKKQVVNLDFLSQAWDSHPEKLEEYCKYNMHDADLTLKLCQKLLFDIWEFSKIIGLPPYDVIRMKFSRLVESYIMKRSMEFNVLAPNKPNDDEMARRMDKSVQGAFVFEPKPGFYKELAVFDFRSLYPSIITAHNIGPEGFRCECCHEKGAVPERPQDWFCVANKKFIPQVLEELILRRTDVKKQMKEAAQRGEDTTMLASRTYALKILANSFYGYLGFAGARWYCLECAGATTAHARHYIKTTIAKAEQEGFTVCYADTDSCFLLLGTKTKDDALRFMHDINQTLPGQMELEYEGYYPRGIFVAQKGKDVGAKKRYALLSEKGKLKIVGFEVVRRNTSTIAREVQEKVLRLILDDKPEEALAYARQIVQDVRQGLIPKEKMVIKTQLTREIDSYTSLGPHVAVAQRLRQQGHPITPGMLIEYIITPGGGLTRERARTAAEAENYDAEYYIYHQIIPAVGSVFAVFGYTEEEIEGEKKQKGLSDFF
ncbi:TPA: hypothetical protein HA241_00520 [Candidatus Woesearchaeota archaeon]|nr:hypothetical protein [Candidatus Woesearchaeota archaeon]